ncbi:MAG: orotidine 5'-phosphate decarboxylase / HUMPS family protein [Actinomycetaceae bacterium]|nr:orotidine 5'-phosphate decarboxylase / HUMPS family protein [Actinomycetaceae bacterium]
MTRLQIALDTCCMEDALRPLAQAEPHIDIIECGTVLIIAEGLRAVREIRALYPDKTILADVRIAEAGAKISRMCFEAGASWVSCVAGASLTTIEQVVKVAKEYNGEVQVELGETYDADRARAWAQLGVKHVIVKRSRDLEAAGTLTWSDKDIERVKELADMGFTITVTGGIKHGELEVFKGAPIGVVIAGRTIVNADDPAESAKALQAEIHSIK